MRFFDVASAVLTILALFSVLTPVETSLEGSPTAEISGKALHNARIHLPIRASVNCVNLQRTATETVAASTYVAPEPQIRNVNTPRTDKFKFGRPKHDGPKTQSLEARVDPGPSGFWCIPGSNINVTIMLTRFIPGQAIARLLLEAWDVVWDVIGSKMSGAMQMPAPGFRWTGHTATIHIWNSNNHLMNWFSVQDAITAIYDYMSSTAFGEAIVTIYDGITEIGRGMIN